MQVHIVRAPADPASRELLRHSFRLRHRLSLKAQGDTAQLHEDDDNTDGFDGNDTTHILIADRGELVGGSRLTPLDKPNLLQTAYNGLVQGDFPAAPSLGADWTRLYVRPDRRDGQRRATVSAALFCAVMEHALCEGFAYITFVSSPAMLEHFTSLGWTVTPLGDPGMANGRLSIAAWIEVSEDALYTMRRLAGLSRVPGSPPLRRLPPEAPTLLRQ